MGDSPPHIQNRDLGQGARGRVRAHKRPKLPLRQDTPFLRYVNPGGRQVVVVTVLFRIHNHVVLVRNR